MRVEIIGGGPGGMYAARLLKLSNPKWQVRVHERRLPQNTFGFGVGLNPSTLQQMATADPATYRGLVAVGHPLHTWRMRIGEQVVSGGENASLGLERATILGVLAKHAQDAGAEIIWGTRTELADVAGADLVIAADGAASAARQALADDIHVTIDTGDLGYIWCGADISLDSMLFEIVDTDDGTFVAHVMPYGPDRVTFQVDARIDTVRRAGCDLDQPSDSGSDNAALAHLSAVFSHLLDGAPLRGNRSVWSTFDTLRCQRWSSGNVVLIGDAAHTAHYSVGSGTRMAMEDALALTRALSTDADLATALAAYERDRRPVTDRLQDRAVRSQQWWTTFPDRKQLPMPQLMLGYMTRTGAIPLDRLHDADSTLVGAALTVLGGDTTPLSDNADVAGVALAVPLDTADLTSPDRDLCSLPRSIRVPVAMADVHAIAKARDAHRDATLIAEIDASDEGLQVLADKAAGAGAHVIALVGATTETALMDALDKAEQLRLHAAMTVAVSAPSRFRDLLAAGLLAGKADLIQLTDPVAGP